MPIISVSELKKQKYVSEDAIANAINAASAQDKTSIKVRKNTLESSLMRKLQANGYTVSTWIDDDNYYIIKW